MSCDARLEHYDVVVAEERVRRNCVGGPARTQGCPGLRATPDEARRVASPEDTATSGGGPRRVKGRSHLGSSHARVVMTLNVGGSREALIAAMETEAHVLVFQEHRVAGPGLPGLQGVDMEKGWHGVWDAAWANGNGRSGGTAVLVRRPVHIFRGGRLDRGTKAVVSWTRRSRIHLMSVYKIT